MPPETAPPAAPDPTQALTELLHDPLLLASKVGPFHTWVDEDGARRLLRNDELLTLVHGRTPGGAAEEPDGAGAGAPPAGPGPA